MSNNRMLRRVGLWPRIHWSIQSSSQPNNLAYAIVFLTVVFFLPHNFLWAQQPPRYYLMTDIGPGRALETRTSGPGAAGFTIGNFFGGFGCSATVLRNGFLLTNDWRMLPLCPLVGDTESIASSLEIEGSPSVVGRSISSSGRQVPVQWTLQANGTFLPSPVVLPLGSLQGIA